jgi:membrane-bound lytic murein transglycosylase F
LTKLLRLIFGVLLTFSLLGCNQESDIWDKFIPPKNQLEKIKNSGSLKVITRLDPTTRYKNNDDYTGLEHDLVNLFADHIGVKVEFIVPTTFAEVLSGISTGKADIAAASLTVSPERAEKMRFSPSYYEVTEQLVYRSGTPRPKNAAGLAKGIIEVTEGTTHINTLHRLKKALPSLNWTINKELDTNGLLYLVNEGLIDYTIADSNQALLVRRFYPELNIAFNLTQPLQLAWAMPLSNDNSLYDEVAQFFNKIKQDKTLEQLIEKHYGHANTLNYVDNCTFRQHRKSRLPLYQKYFTAAANKYQMDWRLLAAIGYQESHWQDNAISPTGVEGIMMLTNDTANFLKIKNRKDPVQSIEGGARFFQQRHKLLNEAISEPDRTWLALAAYNVGMGHVYDAMLITKQQGGNPYKWMDVKQRLPLLTDAKWHSKTKYGYARGNEPVEYVENIRGYYDLLVWLTEENQIKKQVMEVKVQPAEPALVTASEPTTL